MADLNDDAEQFGRQIEIENVLTKARENYGWSDGDAEYARFWYVRYLFLCKNNPSKPLAALSHAADDLWHQHIVDTKKYAKDCQKLFGQFLDHQPIYGQPKSREVEIIEETKAVYSDAFKSLPHDMKVTSGTYSYST